MFRVPLLCMVGAVVCFCGNVTAQEFLPPPPSISVEGYTDQLSYAPGEVVKFQLSGTAPTDVLIERVGAQRTKVYEQAGIAVTDAKTPIRASSHGCNWPVAHQLTIPADWSTGYYEVTLTAKDKGGQFTHRVNRTASSKCFFVVRAAKPGVDSRFSCSFPPILTTPTQIGAAIVYTPTMIVMEFKGIAFRSTARSARSSTIGNNRWSRGLRRMESRLTSQ